MPEVILSGFSRVWLIEGGASPSNAPAYQGLMKIGDPTYSVGDVEKVEIPDPSQYDEFIQVAEVKGQDERPTSSIMGRYPMDLSAMLRLTRQGCAFDLQAHIGKCADPRSFNQGWEKVVVFPSSRVTQYAVENFGALGSDERASTNETADFSAQDMYEIIRIKFAERGSSQVVREIISIDVCDSVACGDCGQSSDGCKKVLATQVASGATPGTAPAVIYSKDGGATFASVAISTLLGNENPSGSACVGGWYVVISNTDEAMHIADIDDLLSGSPSWAQVTNGFVFGQGPNAIVSVGANKTWMAADSGYIYFTDDPSMGVVVQEAGVATTQNLNDIDAYDDLNVVAVGNSNAVLVTDNGGDTWQLVTGPSVGNTLNAVKMLSKNTWLVSSNNTVVAAFWYTEDAGATWTQKTLPIGGTRIDDIKFSNSMVGYLTMRVSGGRGRILRTIDGGYSWYVLPEGTGQIPDNTRINQIAVCADPNVVFGGGLGSNGTDGIIVKAS